VVVGWKEVEVVVDDDRVGGGSSGIVTRVWMSWELHEGVSSPLEGWTRWVVVVVDNEKEEDGIEVVVSCCLKVEVEVVQDVGMTTSSMVVDKVDDYRTKIVEVDVDAAAVDVVTVHSPHHHQLTPD